MAVDRPFHITIARQLGSGGSYLAQRIAHRLGFVYLDHQILEQAAQELDTSGSELARREVSVHWVDRGGDVTYHGPFPLIYRDQEPGNIFLLDTECSVH